MNAMTKILTTLTLSLTVTGIANASNLVATNDSISTELCMTAAAGNRVAMQKAIKQSGLSKSFVVYNVKCNDQHITEFVAKHGRAAEKMNALLNHGRHKGKVTINDVASL